MHISRRKCAKALCARPAAYMASQARVQRCMYVYAGIRRQANILRTVKLHERGAVRSRAYLAGPGFIYRSGNENNASARYNTMCLSMKICSLAAEDE